MVFGGQLSLCSASEDPLWVGEYDLVPLPLVGGREAGGDEAAAARAVRVRPQPRLALRLVLSAGLQREVTHLDSTSNGRVIFAGRR